ncbi:hypothetical protein [Bacillus andreraoultii]|nr:hypothetical protein [Bacillus andreraoultii]
MKKIIEKKKKQRMLNRIECLLKEKEMGMKEARMEGKVNFSYEF